MGAARGASGRLQAQGASPLGVAVSLVHYAPAVSHGQLRDGRHVVVAVTRCRLVDAAHEHFNREEPSRATCAECRHHDGSLDPNLWRVHVTIEGMPMGGGR
jgi:hypothetical protein